MSLAQLMPTISSKSSYTECSLMACLLATRYRAMRGVCFNNMIAVSIISTVAVLRHDHDIARGRGVSRLAVHLGHMLLHYGPLMALEPHRPTVRNAVLSFTMQLCWGGLFAGGPDGGDVYKIDLPMRTWLRYWALSALAHLAPAVLAHARAGLAHQVRWRGGQRCV